MLDQLLAAVQLKKELPDAVGYSTYGPINFNEFPIELLNAIPAPVAEALNNITYFSLSIDNFSSRTQKNIRVFYSGEFQYSPKIKFKRRDIDVKHELNSDNKEIIISELPPNESIYLTLFNTNQHFNIDQVVIGDNAVTKLMQQLASAKRHPELMRMELVTKGFLIVLPCIIIATAYIMFNRVREENIIDKAFSKFTSCPPYIFDNPPEKEKVLERKFNQLGAWSSIVLSINEASSFEELKVKDQIVLCEPKSEAPHK